MLKTEEKQIGNHTYAVTQLGASKGREVLARLFAILGEPLATVAEGLDGKKSAGDLELGVLAAALKDLSRKVKDEDLKYLCATFGAHTEVDGRRLDLQAQELHFAGSYEDMFRWLWFAVEVNYRGFFAALPTAIAAGSGQGSGKAKVG